MSREIEQDVRRAELWRRQLAEEAEEAKFERDRVVRRALDAGLSQARLASLLGLSHQRVSQLAQRVRGSVWS